VLSRPPHPLFCSGPSGLHGVGRFYDYSEAFSLDWVPLMVGLLFQTISRRFPTYFLRSLALQLPAYDPNLLFAKVQDEAVDPSPSFGSLFNSCSSFFDRRRRPYFAGFSNFFFFLLPLNFPLVPLPSAALMADPPAANPYIHPPSFNFAMFVSFFSNPLLSPFHGNLFCKTLGENIPNFFADVPKPPSLLYFFFF